MTAQGIDRARFLSHEAASREQDHLLEDYYAEVDDASTSIAGLRRRRRRVANSPEAPIRTISLVEEDGVLFWRDGVATRARPRRAGGRRTRRGVSEPTGSVVLTREFPVIAHNKVIDAIGAIDRRLNPSITTSLTSRLRQVKRRPDGSVDFAPIDVTGPFTGRTLLLVHGTFSNASSMLEELAKGPFLNAALSGGDKYDRVVAFDHPTLCVSPVMNALELGRAMAGSSGTIDVLAHSRGGLVVRWWLEAFGHTLRLTPNTQVRAVLVGSPLHGTSLAAPDRIQHAMSLISNIGTFAEVTLGLVGPVNPFLWVAGKLVEVIVSVTGALAKTPLVDALTALIPGLASQSAVANNHELNRLRLGPTAVDPRYYAVMSNFETTNPGWRFWRNFRKDRIGDLAADVVFPGDNDLVVDTASMSDFGVPKLKLAGPPCDFGTSEVWHCRYFRELATHKFLGKTLHIAM